MVESIEWCLYAWGRTPDDDWIENSMYAAGVWNPSVGCTDASGAATARWVNDEYGEYGYVAANDPDVSFDDVSAEAGAQQHPIALGGRAWYHWSGVRGYDADADVLLLANPAPGWQGVYQTMTRPQWAALGPWSMVRVTHPQAEGTAPAPQPPPKLDYAFWQQDGKVGSGLIEMMKQDQVYPAQDYSTWLPLGGPPPAQVETCYGQNGVLYVWLLTTNAGFRHRPADG